MDTESRAEQDPAQPRAQVEDAEAFEHVKQGSEPYDAQTYGTELGGLPRSSSSVSTYADCVCQVLLQSHLKREGKRPFKRVSF